MIIMIIIIMVMIIMTNLKWYCKETDDDIGKREVCNEEICHRLQIDMVTIRQEEL